MSVMTFYSLEVRYGSAGAYHCLEEMEKAAEIRSTEVIAVDPEIRLANALHAQDAMCGSDFSIAA